MRKIYIPTNEELKQIQDLGVNLYQYLFTKQIEVIILKGLQLDSILEPCYEYQKQNQDLVHSICYLYPEEIKHSKLAQNDTELCLKLLETQPNNSVATLDDLCLFNNVTLNNLKIIEAAIKKLVEGLDKYPRYRFEYKEPNNLLDRIFSGHMIENQSHLLTPDALSSIIKIDPVYLLKVPEYRKNELLKYGDNIGHLMQDAIHNYANRYEVNGMIGYEYIGKDILTNPNQEVKRLIRNIRK